MPFALHTQAIELFATMATELHVKKGVALDPKYVYYLKKGFVSLSLFTDDGEKHSYLFFQEGEMFNFMPTIRKTMHKESIHLLEKRSHVPLRMYTCINCTILAINSDHFTEKLEESPELQKLLLYSYTENLGNLLVLTTAMTTSNAASRVSFAIMENMADKAPFILPSVFTYNELAAYLSLHPVTVTKIFKALMLEGIIKKHDRERVIVDREALEDIAREKRILVY